MTIFANKYWQRRNGGTSYPVAVSGTGEIPMGSIGWLGTTDDHLLRTYFSPTFRVHVGTVGIPTPLWWGAMLVVALAWWTDTTDTTFYGFDSDYDGLLIAEPLVARMALDPAAVGGYTAIWQPATGPISCGTTRKPQGGVTSPVVNFALQVVDPGVGVIGNTHTGVHAYGTDLEETLWGTPV